MEDGLKKDMYAKIDPEKLKVPGEEGRKGGEVEIDIETLDKCEDEKLNRIAKMQSSALPAENSVLLMPYIS